MLRTAKTWLCSSCNALREGLSTLWGCDTSMGRRLRWLLEYAAGLTDDASGERISFTFTDGAPGNLRRAEMLLHLATHSLYHISVINNELARAKAPTSPVLLTTYHAAVGQLGIVGPAQITYGSASPNGAQA